MDADIIIDSLKFPHQGGTQGEYYNRLEKELIKLIEKGEVSQDTIKVMAFILMGFPDNFGCSNQSTFFTFERSREFLSQQTEETKTLFEVEALKLPPGHPDRVSTLLSAP